MKIMVTYMSQTGNTKRVAESIFEEVQGEKELKELSEVENLDGYDLTFVGFPMQAFGPAQAAKDFLANNCSGKKIALFTTHGVTQDFEDLPKWLDSCRQAAIGAHIIGLFNCQGEIADFLLDAAAKSDDPLMQKLAEAGATGKGQPDAASLDRARAFAREMFT